MKAKKATAGEKNVANNLGWDIAGVRLSCAASKSAKEIDRLIAVAVRRERREILDQIWAAASTGTRSTETLKFLDNIDWAIRLRRGANP